MLSKWLLFVRGKDRRAYAFAPLDELCSRSDRQALQMQEASGEKIKRVAM